MDVRSSLRENGASVGVHALFGQLLLERDAFFASAKHDFSVWLRRVLDTNDSSSALDEFLSKLGEKYPIRVRQSLLH
jgi:hypothetical protein